MTRCRVRTSCHKWLVVIGRMEAAARATQIDMDCFRIWRASRWKGSSLWMISVRISRRLDQDGPSFLQVGGSEHAPLAAHAMPRSPSGMQVLRFCKVARYDAYYRNLGYASWTARRAFVVAGRMDRPPPTYSSRTTKPSSPMDDSTQFDAVRCADRPIPGRSA